jgi:hypothetical protein
MTRHILIWASLLSLAGCNSSAAPREMSCAGTRAFSQPWHELTDAQLAIEIDRACGRVLIGFKEEGAVRGVDSHGRNLTSAETVSRMKTELATRGITVEGTSSLLPYVRAQMSALDAVSALRHHRNIDYLEPLFAGEWD